MSPSAKPGELLADGELVEALLATFAALEIHVQLGVLLERAAAWTGATCGFALAAGEERRALAPVATTLVVADPRRGAFGRVEPERLRRWLGGQAQVYDGLGPFAEVAPNWPPPLPVATVAVPVTGPAGEGAGVLVLTLPHRPDPAALERIARLLERARPAIANALAVRAMRELVIKDDTAHCFNRRHFETCLPEELARAGRFNTPMSLIFLDMDNLKEVNNKHGHAVGSLTLCEVSRRVRSKIRRFDKLFRFGGDEFCIVLPETEWHGALEVAERVRDAIARQAFLSGELNDPAGLRMTASLGIASFPLHAKNQRELIEQADRAMQRIKNGTKNSIGIAEIVGDEHAD